MPTIANADLPGHCIHAGFLSNVPVFADAGGSIFRLEGALKEKQAHQGLLCAAETPDRRLLVTGGEDGKVIATNAAGETKDIGAIARKWITSVAAGPNGIAFASGKSAIYVETSGKTHEQSIDRSIEGVALAPKGTRMALARYNGVTLSFPGTQGKPVDLEWKGAHHGVCFSPDGRFIVTTMQENALHGWRIEDGKHMRMTGYPAKIKSWSWSAKGRWLATSGAEAAIVWPFHFKDGPMGKPPLELGTRAKMKVTAVACHPEEEVCAVGFDDGMIMAVRFADNKEVLLRRGGKGALTSMGWDAGGFRLAFGSETGDCGVIDIAG
ncbi:MAG: WD40 repeat domain-containing protein [Rhizobiaceae bacterium]